METQKHSLLKFTLLILLLIAFNTAYSQQRGNQPHPAAPEKPGKPYGRITKLNEKIPDKLMPPNWRNSSAEQEQLIRDIKLARKSGDRTETQTLQSKLNKLNGVITKRGEQSGYIVKAGNQIHQSDNIDLTQIHYDNNVKGIATVTEQTGENKGRIWTIATGNYFNKTDYSQTNFYYSDDNGINWIFYAYAYNSYEINAPDAIDAEIIEDNTGTKYLYVVYGAVTVSTGKYICNLITVTISGTVGGSVQRLEWPGFDYFNTDVRYYKPRICTDNAFWTGGAYLYIAACQDSIDGMQTIFSEKVAFIDNPYTPTPGVNYKPEVFWYYSFDNGDFQGRCDIAWFDDPGNGGGSVILAESGAYFTTAIYLYETADVNYLGLPVYEGYLDPDGLTKSSAHIASNGLYQNLMIVNVSEYDPYDHDIQYFTTTDAGDNWTDGFVSYTYDDDNEADVTGLRNNPGNYYSVHADFNLTFDNVFYSVARENVWSDFVVPMNHIDASVEVSPKAGIKTGGSDSCFVIWTEWNSNANMWGSSGCEGILSLSRALAMGVYIEGYYDPGSYSMTRTDTITVSFRENFFPYTLVDSKKLPLYNNGYFLLNSNLIDAFTDYYIVVNHRNTIETWSAAPVNFGGGSSFYFEFISSDAKAYGNNEKYLGTDLSSNDYYGLYSGDVNQDGVIDAGDLSQVENDASNSLTGYESSDVTGDDYVDAADLSIVENNALTGVYVITP